MPIKISAASVSKYSLLAINALSCATAIFLTFQARLSPDEALIPLALPEREITRLGYPQTNLSIGEFDFSKSFRDYVRVIEQGDGDGTVRIVRRPITKQGISANKGLPPPRPRPNGAPPVVAQPPGVSQPAVPRRPPSRREWTIQLRNWMPPKMKLKSPPLFRDGCLFMDQQ